jgi:hypothetical protein
VVPVLQGRKGAFFIDAQKGAGYDLQNASGWYFEHTLGYNLGRGRKMPAGARGQIICKAWATLMPLLIPALPSAGKSFPGSVLKAKQHCL